MSGIGIIAEYNPFHNGHAYQLAEAKRLSNADHIIVVMSGSFVQRGEPACTDKFTRSKWALRGGADLVIELPDVLSLACAERFSYGGVRLLSATGLVNGLCFGSERGDIDMLSSAASVNFSGETLKNALSAGLPYPTAVSEQLRSLGVELNANAPNDTLGIEYIRAVKRLAPTMRIFAVKRKGSGYNDTETGGCFASASRIRRAIAEGQVNSVRISMPEFVCETIEKQLSDGRFPASESSLSDAVLFALRTLGSDGVSKLADVSEGLENVFARFCASSSNYAELLSCVKTKRYTMNRLKRICMNALLGTTSELQTIAATQPEALYLRVLGVRREKMHLLSELAKNASLPVIVTHSDLSKLNEMQLAILEHSRRASAIRALACPMDKSTKDDFSHRLIVV